MHGVFLLQGHLRTALQYTEMMPAESATALAAIRDRLYNCGAGGMPAQPVNLTAPFQPVDVQPAPGAEAAEAATAAPAAANQNQGVHPPEGLWVRRQKLTWWCTDHFCLLPTSLGVVLNLWRTFKARSKHHMASMHTFCQVKQSQAADCLDSDLPYKRPNFCCGYMTTMRYQRWMIFRI